MLYPASPHLLFHKVDKEKRCVQMSLRSLSTLAKRAPSILVTNMTVIVRYLRALVKSQLEAGAKDALMSSLKLIKRLMEVPGVE